MEGDLFRLNGDLLLLDDSGNKARAEESFRDAISIARIPQAKSCELRATISLARLLAETDRRDEARIMLGEIYGWFTEGFHFSDLRSAKALLAELTS